MLPITDTELFTALCRGFQFLGMSYDVVPSAVGFSLRAVDDKGELAYFETFATELELLERLKTELEEAAVTQITGKPRRDLNWEIK